jgi:hypothetical protein
VLNEGVISKACDQHRKAMCLTIFKRCMIEAEEKWGEYKLDILICGDNF